MLRDVAYRIHAEMLFLGDAAKANPRKYIEMFARRATKGQCKNQPYLGCREFAARFRLVGDVRQEPAPISDTRRLGWMLYDLDYTNEQSPSPMFFNADMVNGVIDLRDVEVVR